LIREKPSTLWATAEITHEAKVPTGKLKLLKIINHIKICYGSIRTSLEIFKSQLKTYLMILLKD